MPTQAMVGFTPPTGLDLVVEGLDPSVEGREALVEVVQVATVHDERPVHGRLVLWSESVTLDASGLIIPITLEAVPPCAYDGEQVTVELRVRLVLEGAGWFSKDQVLVDEPVPLARASHGDTEPSRALMEPKDEYSLELAIGSLGPDAARRLALRGAAFATGALTLGAAAFWVGGCFSLVFSLVAMLLASKFLYNHTMKELAGYSGLAFGFVPPLDPETVLPIRQLLVGLPRTDIPRPRLRIVACNLERGQYKRGSGTDVRTVSFSEPAGAVVLYDCEIEVWRKGVALADAFAGDVDFGPAFAALVPPQVVEADHGIGLRWEAQLIVPDLVDVELEGPTEAWHWPSDWTPAT